MSTEWLGHADIETYRKTRRKLSAIDIDILSPQEASHVRSMISDCNYVIEWLETGRRPGNRRGIERRSVAQRDIPMDPLTMRRYMYTGKRGAVDSHNDISAEQVIMMEEALSILTKQQCDSFVMVKVNGYSLEYAAEIMGLKKTSVQNHVDRASLKVSTFVTKYHHQISLGITG